MLFQTKLTVPNLQQSKARSGCNQNDQRPLDDTGMTNTEA